MLEERAKRGRLKDWEQKKAKQQRGDRRAIQRQLTQGPLGAPRAVGSRQTCLGMPIQVSPISTSPRSGSRDTKTIARRN